MASLAPAFPSLDFKAMTNNPSTSGPDSFTMKLDESALQAAATIDLRDGAVTPGSSPYSDAIVKLLNDALATELVCVLRYKRHHFTAHGMASPAIADELMTHANEEAAHADKIAKRIVQLGGSPNFEPSSLLGRSHAEYDASDDLKDMLRANLRAERVAVEAYRQMIRMIGDKDPTTRRMLEEILADEEEHADEISDWLTK